MGDSQRRLSFTHHPFEAFGAALLGGGAAGQRFGRALECQLEVVATPHI